MITSVKRNFIGTNALHNFTQLATVMVQVRIHITNQTKATQYLIQRTHNDVM